MKSKLGLFVVIAVWVAASLLMWTGCERFSSESRQIAITPETTELLNGESHIVTLYAGEYTTNTSSSATNDPVVFAGALFYPLEWSVSDPSLGIILSSTGNSAVYQSEPDAEGVNIVHCRDQADREGSAVVNLTELPETNETEVVEGSIIEP